MPTSLSNVMYNPAYIIGEKIKVKLSLNNKSILQDIIRQRLSETQLGEQARGELVAQQCLSDSAVELAAMEHYNQLADSTRKDFQKEIDTFQNLLKKQKSSTAKFGLKWGDIEDNLENKLTSYTPEYDADADIRSIAQQLEDEKSKFFAREILAELPENRILDTAPQTEDIEGRIKITVPDKGIMLQFVQETENPHEKNKPLAHTSILYWLYDDVNEENIEQEYLQRHQENGSSLPVGIGITDSNGWLILNTDSALENGFIKNGDAFHFYSIADKNRFASPWDSEESMEDYRLAFIHQQAANSHETREKKPVSNPYCLDAAERKIRNAIVVADLSARQKRNYNYWFQRNRKYGFMILPVGLGHILTKDLRQLAKDSAAAKTAFVKVGRLDVDVRKYQTTVELPMTLKERERQLQIQTLAITRDLQERNEHFKLHGENIHRVNLIKTLVETHQKYPVNEYATGSETNTRYQNDLLGQLREVDGAYQKILKNDLNLINQRIDDKAGELLQTLRGEQLGRLISEEFAHLNGSQSNDTTADSALPAPTTGMQVDTAWPHLYQTLTDCLLILSQTALKKEAWQELGEKIVGIVSANDELERYVPSQSIIRDFKKLGFTDESFLEQATAINQKEATKQFLNNSTIDSDSDFKYIEKMFESGVKPPYGMFNDMPGPPTVLQVLVYCYMDDFARYAAANTVAKPGRSVHFLRITNPMLYATYFASRSSQAHTWNEEAFKKLQSNVVKLNTYYSIAASKYNSREVQNSITELRREIRVNILENADISNALAYRALCTSLNIYFAIAGVRGLIEEGVDAWDSEVVSRKLLGRFVMDGGQALYTGATTVSLLSRVFANKPIWQTLGKNSAHFAQRMGNILAVTGVVFSGIELIHHIRTRDTDAMVKDVFNIFVSGGFLLGNILVRGVGAFALLNPMGTAVLFISALMAISVFLFRVIFDDKQPFRTFLLQLHAGISHRGLSKNQQGIIVDLRPQRMKTAMKKVQILIEDIHWQRLNWRAAIPLYHANVEPSNAMQLIDFNRVNNYPRRQSTSYERYRLLEQTSLGHYFKKLEAQVMKEQQDKSLLPMSFPSGRTYREVYRQLMDGTFTPDYRFPEDIVHSDIVWDLVKIDKQNIEYTHDVDAIYEPVGT